MYFVLIANVNTLVYCGVKMDSKNVVKSINLDSSGERYVHSQEPKTEQDKDKTKGVWVSILLPKKGHAM